MKVIDDKQIRQLRTRGDQLVRVADILDTLNNVADGYRPKPKRRKMSRAARLLISKAQKKRWAKARRK